MEGYRTLVGIAVGVRLGRKRSARPATCLNPGIRGGTRCSPIARDQIFRSPREPTGSFLSPSLPGPYLPPPPRFRRRRRRRRRRHCRRRRRRRHCRHHLAAGHRPPSRSSAEVCYPRRDRGSHPVRYVISDPSAANLTAEQATHRAHSTSQRTPRHIGTCVLDHRQPPAVHRL